MSLRSPLYSGSLLALTVLILAGKPRAQAPPAPVPESLKEVVFGATKRPTIDVILNGHRFRAIPNLGKGPHLAWPADAEEAPRIPYDRRGAERWLAKCATALGLRDFVPRFCDAGQWRGLTVWNYELVREDLVLHGAVVSVYWDEGRFVGLLCTLVAPMSRVAEPAPEERGRADRVYYARRTGLTSEVVVARLARRETATHRITGVVIRAGTVYELFEQKGLTVTPLANGTFTEFQVPSGTFPDQIWADSTGIIWFSQPLQNQISSYDPTANTFKQFPAPGAPDGLWVDDEDRVWTGLYNSGQLGLLDVPTKTFQAFNAPYSGARLAIPSPSASGGVWVTDHVANRISEWDPVNRKWLGSYVIPTPGVWVVAGALDPTRGDVYFTEVQGNALAYKPKGGPIQSLKVPAGGGPAFLGFHDDKVYYSLWSANRLGEYDVVAKKFKEYTYIAGETGGPLSIAPTGHVVVGTCNQGYVVVFDPQAKTFANYKIPTSFPGLKDGLTVAHDGSIWFTESGRNKIARLVLP